MEVKLKTISVMDYSDANVYVFENVDMTQYEDDDSDDFCEVLFYDAMNEKHGLNLKESNCYYMSADEIEVINL